MVIVVAAETLREQLLTIFGAWGMTPEDSAGCADVMVATDLRGVDSHGVGMLSTYDLWRRNGRLNLTPQCRIVREQPALAAFDADNGLGHPPSLKAMTWAMDAARTQGAAIAVVGHSNHHGAAGYYAQLASEQGLIGLCLTGTPTRMMPPLFGREPRLGTNPLAFAAPARDNKPMVLDMATTTVAFGKVSIAKRGGKDLPAGWVVDAQGQPVTDAEIAYENRLLTPLGGTRTLGGHKGYGLALMVEVLASALVGAYFGGRAPDSEELGETFNVGHFFMAIDPTPARGGAGLFEADVDRLIALMRSTTPIDPDQPVLVPGDPEHDAVVRRGAEGIPMVAALVEEVRAVAAASGVPFLLPN